jgi:type II secretory pathway component PulM
MSPSFCEACREADAKAARRHNDPHLKRQRRLMDDEIGLERASAETMKARPTPNATIEAIKQSVRDRGVAALKEAANRERLSRCDAEAVAEIDRWVARLERTSR